MARPVDWPAKLERWLALVVRYWAFNMTLVHDRGTNWPGFGYSDKEKKTLGAIAGKVPTIEYAVWLGLVVMFILLIMAGVTLASMGLLQSAIGGKENLVNTPAAAFYLIVVLDLVVSLSIGFPAAMVPAAGLVGRWFEIDEADLPDRLTTSIYFHKLWFQIARVAVVCSLGMLLLWLFVPSDSKFRVMAQLIVPLLSPAVAALTTAFYFSVRLRRSASIVKPAAG
jgi:hypothetical protein